VNSMRSLLELLHPRNDERDGALSWFSIRAALFATVVIRLFFVAKSQPASRWSEKLLWRALGVRACQPVSVCARPPGATRRSVLAPAVFRWTCLATFSHHQATRRLAFARFDIRPLVCDHRCGCRRRVRWTRNRNLGLGRCCDRSRCAGKLIA